MHNSIVHTGWARCLRNLALTLFLVCFLGCSDITLAADKTAQDSFESLSLLLAEAHLPTWRELANPTTLAPGVTYYSFNSPEGAQVHLVVVDYQSQEWVIKPVVGKTTTTTSYLAHECDAIAAINGGYFNLSDGESASFITIDSKKITDPHTNQALVTNPKLMPHLPKIFNRTEIRFLEDGQGKSFISIATHNQPLPKDSKLIHALQGGPRLLPYITDFREGFIRNDNGKLIDSIGARRPAARTAFGITRDGYALLVCVGGKRQNPETSGVTLSQLSRLLESLGCTEAVNLDGGASSTMFISAPRSLEAPSPLYTRSAADGSSQSSASLPTPGKIICCARPETLIRSALVVLHKD